jgi:hypothetical protein
MIEKTPLALEDEEGEEDPYAPRARVFVRSPVRVNSILYWKVKMRRSQYY